MGLNSHSINGAAINGGSARYVMCAAAISAAAIFGATASLTHFAEADIAASASMTGDATTGVIVSFNAGASFTAAHTLTKQASASVTASANLTGGPLVHRYGAAEMVCSAGFAGDATLSFLGPAVSFVGSAGFSAHANIEKFAVGAFTASATFAPPTYVGGFLADVVNLYRAPDQRELLRPYEMRDLYRSPT